MNIDCDLTMGWNDKLCALSVGGIKRDLIVPIEKLDFETLNIVNNEITTLALKDAGDGGYMYELEQNLSSATYPPVRSLENGSVLSNIELNVVLNNDTKELRAELFRLARNTSVHFVQKSNKEWIALGLYEGLRMNDGGEGGTGVEKTDRNGYSLTFVGQEMEAVPNIDEALINALIKEESPSSSI